MIFLLAAALATTMAGWTAHPADGVEMHLTREADVNRLDFDFHGHGGYAIARQRVDLDLPANYQIVFRMRGEAPPENLELKLLESGGENVWWRNRRNFEFPAAWTLLKTKKRQIEFAWGPQHRDAIRHVESFEIVVTAGSGGKGTVWFSDPAVEPLPVVTEEPLHFTTSHIDLGMKREIGGLRIDWTTEPHDFGVMLDGVAQNATKTSRFVWLPESEARQITITGGSVREVIVEPPSWAPGQNDFWSIVAKDAPRGAYPRYLIGQQAYWTVIGADIADNEALIGEDGNVEPFKGGDSIEPALIVKGKRLTWADVKITHALAEGDLPIPSVTWKGPGGVSMTLTAAVSNSSMLQLRYRITGNAKLDLQVRPFQVNPSTQFLNLEGGVSHDRRSAVPAAVAGRHARRPNETEVDIPLQPNAKRESFEAIAAGWRKKLHRVAIEIGGAPQIADTIRTSVAYMLIHRDGPALKPGSRSYDRAWIRDGALMGALLLRLGHAGVAKSFAEWVAGFQYPDGKIPCCVDTRGADPVPENDSHGEFIGLVAETFRVTHDVDFVRRLWPHVDRAATYINTLRSANHGEFEGLVTESISHEGYSAKAVHSYWDDVFCLKGVEDAAMLAGVLSLDARQRELERQAADFRRDLTASIQRTTEQHHLDYVPASAELGDFDPTSTAIAISPLNLTSLFPSAALRKTYDLYLQRLAEPRDDYTPYEMRIIGALIRLGRRDRALQLVDRFLRDRRPAPWNEWAEVVRTQYRKPGFIGDMPHAWVASDFVRSILDAVAYDAADGALVIGAGVPARWLPLHVGPLRMNQGAIDVRMQVDGGNAIVEVTGEGRNLVVVSPFDAAKSRKIDRLPARIVFDR